MKDIHRSLLHEPTRALIPENRPYVIDQAKTLLVEAVFPGVTHYALHWNGSECIVPGLGSVVKSLQNGLNEVTDMGPRYNEEAYRRRKELEEQEMLNMLIAKRILGENKIAYILSPPPIDTMDENTRRELGYGKKGKVRVYNPQGDTIHAHELFVEGNEEWWHALAHDLSVELPHNATSTDFLQLHIADVQSKGAFIHALLNRIYGKEAEHIVAKSQLVEREAAMLAEKLAQGDVQLGEALQKGRLSKEQVIQLKERALIKAIVQLSSRTGIGRFAHTQLPWVREQIPVCGMLLNSHTYMTPFQLGFERFRTYTFGTEKKIVECPGCNNDVVIASKAARSISCPHCKNTSQCPEAIYNGATRSYNELIRKVPALQEVEYSD